MTHRWAGRWLQACVGIGLALALGGAAQAEETSGAAGLPVEQIEQIVRDYLMREPELIYQALEELQRRQAAAETERQRAAIAANREQLINDAGDPVAGNPDGDVTLVEFFDYQCAYCRQVVKSVRELIDGGSGAPGRVQGVPDPRRGFGDRGAGGARGARAGSLPAVPLRPDGNAAISRSTASWRSPSRSVSTPSGWRATCTRPRSSQQLQANFALAQTLGIEGTPAFVIGDEVIPGAVDKQPPRGADRGGARQLPDLLTAAQRARLSRAGASARWSGRRRSAPPRG